MLYSFTPINSPAYQHSVPNPILIGKSYIPARASRNLVNDVVFPQKFSMSGVCNVSENKIMI